MQIISKFCSPNYSVRSSNIKYIILHYTELNFDTALKSYLDPKIELSPHYLIHEDGRTFNLVADNYVAWHAGKSYWQGIERLNEHSIGIEIDNLGNNKFPRRQLDSCIELCQYLVKLHNIPPQNILGHSDIACDRKIDPGIFFDWSYLARHNLGLWPSQSTIRTSSDLIYKFGDKGLEILDLQKKLAAIGYKISLNSIFDTPTNYAIRAFQSHFYPKLIHAKGLDYYKDNSSKYEWNSLLDNILENLIT